MSPTPEDATQNKKDVESIKEFQINKDFLEFTFNKEIDDFKVNPGSNPGDNYLSVIHAVEVKFKGENITNYYVIKCYPNHPGRREMLDQMDIFKKELFVYDEYFPQLQKVVEESGASHLITNLSCAPFHGGNTSVAPAEKYKNSPWEEENFIIMTDLRKHQYKMGNRLTGLDIEHAKLVLKTLAKMYALGWALKQKRGWETLGTFSPLLMNNMYDDVELMGQWRATLDQINTNTLNILMEGIGSDHPAFINFKKLVGKDTEIMGNYVRPQGFSEEYFEGLVRTKLEEDPTYSKEPWLSSNHGDAWVNNMLFKYEEKDGKSKLLDVVLLDFQMYQEACITTDISYFLNSSVRAQIRKANQNEFLEAYYNSFIQTCEVLDVPPFPGFSLKNLIRRYRRTQLYGILISLPLLTFVLKPPEESVDLDSVSKDADVTEMFANVTTGSDKNVTFREEITSSILHLYELGIL